MSEQKLNLTGFSGGWMDLSPITPSSVNLVGANTCVKLEQPAGGDKSLCFFSDNELVGTFTVNESTGRGHFEGSAEDSFLVMFAAMSKVAASHARQ